MYKRRFLLLLISACLLAGCGSKKKENVLEQTEAVLPTESILPSEATQEEFDNIDDVYVFDGTPYSWNDISVVIPSAWEDLYVVKEDANGISFYQKKSYEVEQSLGYLCGFYKSNSYSNAGAGDTLLAYTGEGICYYLVQPTDVACYTENEEILDEYLTMLEQIPWIRSSVVINAKDIYYDVEQYVIPVSNLMKLEAYHMEVLTDNQLWIARNEIYARHGKQFKNEYLQAYFNSCSWYEPKDGKLDVTERELNDMELSNLNLIIAAEAAYEASHPYPKKLDSEVEFLAPLEGNEKEHSILYQVEKVGEAYQCILTIDHKEYHLNDYVDLVNPVMDTFYLTDISENFGDLSYEDGLEIAVLDYGPSDDPQTFFFKYKDGLTYMGSVEGFPFEEQEYLNGFHGANYIVGQARIDLIETAYIDSTYWYNREEGKFELIDGGLYNYKWYKAHELYTAIPVYSFMNEDAPMHMLEGQKEVYFIKTDGKEWILVRGKDGVEGYIHVKDGIILNIGLPAEEIFSDLHFFG